MTIVYGLIWLVIVAVVGLGILALARKAARGVPTAGNIARAHLRAQDERDRIAAQNAAADAIIAEHAAGAANTTNALHGLPPGPYTTDQIEAFYAAKRERESGKQED
jgi:hypothetical protein